MNIKLHPLVQKTKIELEKLDKQKRISWEIQVKYNSAFLPISVESKLRTRALRFMNALINLLETNNHSIKFELNRCHIEMYGQLTEINLRQKYFRKRIKDSSGYGSDTYEKSNKLEFQVGSYARKGWIDKKTKMLEDYLPVIYSYIEKDSIWWAELRKRQRIEEKEREIQQKLDDEKAKLIAIENKKLEKLIADAANYKKASEIRSYLKSLQKKVNQTNSLNNTINKDYLEWAHNKADEIDPMNNISEE
jgi:hypothetical protein